MSSRSDVAGSSNTSLSPRMWANIFAGLAASLVGIGLARFAYTPLIPSLIKAHWFATNDVVYLGAANLAGYLLGALVGRPLAARTSNVAMLRGMMLLATVSLLACAFPLSVAWFFVWRALSGVAGGVIMVLVAATVLPQVPSTKRGIASGAVFLGLGLGIEASGTVVPLLLRRGLAATWVGLAVISAVLSIASWPCWPSEAQSETQRTSQSRRASKNSAQPSAGTSGRDIIQIYIVYALMALAVVPPMVFLADFVVRGWMGGAGEHVGAVYWILYGLGSIGGPPLYGWLADRLGAHATVRSLLLIQVATLIGLAVVRAHWLFAVIAVVLGTFPAGIVPMTLAWIREARPTSAEIQDILWSRTTSIFAAVQAAAAYAYSAVFAATNGNY
ncbi:MAG TPA: YbfB/YjiJ family MFS transporter, partial [Gemmatimonadaceae bacterium]